MTQRIMLFIDGENLVARFQALKNAGRVPFAEVVHEADVFVWRRDFAAPDLFNMVRAHYYTSMVGDEMAVTGLIERIKKQRSMIGLGMGDSRLYPVVFKKPAKSQKTTTVDVRLTVDALSHLYQDNVDVVYLMTGDGDFCPLAEEITRRGKRLFVGAFSDGLNHALVRIADQFFDLDTVFFRPQNS